MAKDMYDENNLLRPEYYWTESEKKKMLYENEKSPEEEIKNSLMQMQRMAMINNISFSDFEMYYHMLINGINTGIIKDYLTFLLSLSSATVLTLYDREKVKLALYKEKVNDLIAVEVRKGLDSQGINLEQYFENAKNRIKYMVLRFTEFCEYCELLNIAIMAKANNAVCFELLKALQVAQVEPTKTYAEAIELNRYQRLIADYIKQFELQQGTSRK